MTRKRKNTTAAPPTIKVVSVPSCFWLRMGAPSKFARNLFAANPVSRCSNQKASGVLTECIFGFTAGLDAYA